MNTLQNFRTYLEKLRSKPPEVESPCTCGHEDHACVHYFRVDGKLVAAVVPETRTIAAQELAEAIGGARVERAEPINTAASSQEQPQTQPRALDDPFDAVVYIDEALVHQSGLVFCPRMFLGRQAQCFHVPTREFLDLTHARVLPLTSASIVSSDHWAV